MIVLHVAVPTLEVDACARFHSCRTNLVCVLCHIIFFPPKINPFLGDYVSFLFSHDIVIFIQAASGRSNIIGRNYHLSI